MGKRIESYSFELLEKALKNHVNPTTREVLQAAGRIRPLNNELRRKIIPGITLTEIHSIMAKSPRPTLTDIIVEQRGTSA